MDDLGWLDTPIFVHPLFPNDPLASHCRDILRRLQTDEVTGWLDPIVIHELTYALPRTKLPGFSARQGVAQYIRRILALDSIRADSKDELLEGLAVWSRGQVAFADARLSVLARQRGMRVCSPNRADFDTVPNSFPPE